MKKSLIMKTAIVLAVSSAFATTASASCGNGNLYCSASSQGSNYAMSSQSSYGHSSYGQSSYMPFTSSAPMSGPISINGLGANEFLQPTSCPVNVNGLESGQTVLGCYNVARRTQRMSYHYAAPRYVQVVHPIIYVRYAVPTPVYTVPIPVPVPVYQPRPQPMPMCGVPMMPRPPMYRGCGW